MQVKMPVLQNAASGTEAGLEFWGSFTTRAHTKLYPRQDVPENFRILYRTFLLLYTYT